MYLFTPYAKGRLRPTFFLFSLLLISSFSFGNNIDNGGDVAVDQTICFGEIPAAIINVADASGGDNGLAIEYLWMKSVPGVSDWEAIPGATGATYAPPALNQTTAFIRCARRFGFTTYTGESNVVLITVLEGPIAIITSATPDGLSNGDSILFTGTSSLAYAILTWDFGDGTTATGASVKHAFDFGGDKVVTLTATNPNNGCTSTASVAFFLLGPLPVELAYFYGEATEDKVVELHWSTIQEEINSHFEIEKSLDGNRFEVIGYLSGNGTTNEAQVYSYKDELPVSGINYYRLKQIDYTGEFSFSEVIAIRLEHDSKLEYTLFPNPTVNEINVRFHEVFDQEINLQIRDISNRIVHQQMIPASSLKQTMDVRDLAPGIYTITLWSSSIRSQRLFVKTDL